MGGYLERNVRAFQDIQKALQEQSQRVYGDNSRVSQDLWAQFMNLQGPAMQSLMQAYIEQSQKMFAQFQEQMQSQARNMLVDELRVTVAPEQQTEIVEPGDNAL